jgi:cell wall-associated NlpC family hydrolase
MSQEPSKVYSKYVGVPYLDKGRTPDGWDCYGLYVFLLNEIFGLKVNPYNEIYTTADADLEVIAAIATQKRHWQRIELQDAQEGDGIVFNLAGHPLHCGYIIERGVMLHALKGRNTCIERYDTSGWNRRIEGIYRWT